LQEQVSVDFVEVISENYMVDGGNPLRVLENVRERTPVILHGVSMSVGSADGLDSDYLLRLKQLAAANRAAVGIRPYLLDTHERAQQPRPAAAALHPRSTAGGLRQHPPRSGNTRSGAGAGKPLELPHCFPATK
jgi:hypothetical protein